MHTSTFKINWDTLSRVFIATLFVFSGWGKLMNFQSVTNFIDSVLHTGSITPAITATVIFVEIVVAILYAYGKYKKDICGYVLVTFTVLATVLFHTNTQDPAVVQQILKNLAIVGGLFATLNAVHNRRSLK
jgi:putative oxidoreductase